MAFVLPLNKLQASLVTLNWNALCQQVQNLTKMAVTQTKLETQSIYETNQMGAAQQQIKNKEADDTYDQYYAQACGAWSQAGALAAGALAGLGAGLAAGRDTAENEPNAEEETTTVSGNRPTYAELPPSETEMTSPSETSGTHVNPDEMVAAHGTTSGDELSAADKSKAQAKVSTQEAVEDATTTQTNDNKKTAAQKDKEQLDRLSNAYQVGSATSNLVGGILSNIANGIGLWQAGLAAQKVQIDEGEYIRAQTAGALADKNYQIEANAEQSFEKGRDSALQSLATLINLSQVRG